MALPLHEIFSSSVEKNLKQNTEDNLMFHYGSKRQSTTVPLRGITVYNTKLSDPANYSKYCESWKPHNIGIVKLVNKIFSRTRAMYVRIASIHEQSQLHII